MNKSDIKNSIIAICDEILKEVIEPVCNFSGGICDYWCTDIETFTGEYTVLYRDVLDKLQEHFKLSDKDMENFDPYTPLIQISLYIYLRESVDND